MKANENYAKEKEKERNLKLIQTAQEALIFHYL